MRSDKWPLIAVFFLAILSGAGLLRVSQMVQHSEDRMAQIDRDIMHQQETIQVLKAEWSYLNRPDYLEGLAQEYLSVTPDVPSSRAQMIDVSTDLPPVSDTVIIHHDIAVQSGEAP